MFCFGVYSFLCGGWGVGKGETAFPGPYLVGEAAFLRAATSTRPRGLQAGLERRFLRGTAQNLGFGGGGALEHHRGGERAIPCLGRRAGAPEC